MSRQERSFLTVGCTKEIIEIIKYPLAVRSSSLLEDSQYQPLAGMYSTYMLPNSHANNKERFNNRKFYYLYWGGERKGDRRDI